MKFSLKKFHGKPLSFNNYNDIFYGLSISKLLKKNAGTVIIKHANPSGVSESKDQIKSFNGNAPHSHKAIRPVIISLGCNGSLDK